jgi:hypothetical protein
VQAVPERNQRDKRVIVKLPPAAYRALAKRASHAFRDPHQQASYELRRLLGDEACEEVSDAVSQQ